MIIITIISIYIVSLYAIYLIDGISADITQCHEDRIDAWYNDEVAVPKTQCIIASYTLTLDERLCKWLAPRYGRITEIVTIAALVWRSRKGDRDMKLELETLVEERVQKALEKRLESMVADSIIKSVKCVNLDTLIERVLGEPTMEESQEVVHELNTPKTVAVSNGETLDALDTSRFEVDSKGHLTSLLAESGEILDCTSHRFRATPHFNSGKLCSMVQGTTKKVGIIIGQYTTDKYLCLTSRGGVVVRRMSAVSLEGTSTMSAPIQRRDEVKVATAGDYTVAAPDYRGNHPIAFMADGTLLTRADGTVVTVQSTTPKGRLWLSDPAMIPTSIRGNSQTIMPVVYTN